MKNQDKIRIFYRKQEKQDVFKMSGKNQESIVAAKPVNVILNCFYDVLD